jgi:Holliday junction resolvase RusA-like endonuclease
MTSVSFIVPGQPVSTNHGYRPARFGKRHGFVLTDAGEAYKARLLVAARRAWMNSGRPAALERAVVGVRFGFKTAASDIDGPLKFTLDSLQAGRLVVNDNRITRVVLERIPGEPRTEVSIAAPGAGCPACGCECARVSHPMPLREGDSLDTPASARRTA